MNTIRLVSYIIFMAALSFGGYTVCSVLRDPTISSNQSVGFGLLFIACIVATCVATDAFWTSLSKK
jgi:hypothetical protein